MFKRVWSVAELNLTPKECDVVVTLRHIRMYTVRAHLLYVSVNFLGSGLVDRREPGGARNRLPGCLSHLQPLLGNAAASYH